MIVTDEMVETAWKEYIQKRHATNTQAMRAALEAAMAVRKTSAPEIVRELRQRIFGTPENYLGVRPDELCHSAAACIEDLAAELNRLAPPRREGFFDHPSRSTLAKWGLEK